MRELWDKIIDLVISASHNSNDYDKKYMETKLNLENDLPLKRNAKTL